MPPGPRPQRFRLEALTLDTGGDRPLYLQLERRLRDAILSGRLPPEERLPSTRLLAQQLGVSRNTAVKAYEQLRVEGFLDTRRGSGTRVAATLPDDLLHAPRRTQHARAARRNRIRLAHNAERLRDVLTWMQQETERLSRPFRAHTPASDVFPRETWTQLTNRRQRTLPRRFTERTNPTGYRPLREAVAVYLGASRDVSCTADNVMITAGAQQGIGLLARLLIDDGDVVVMENPGYTPAAVIFETAGARIKSIPVDDNGLDLSRLRRLDPPPKLVYVTPSSQFPLGMTMPLSRRLALLDWADRENVTIVEDDYNGEYRYSGRPVAALHALAAPGRVIYTGSFSKLLFPALRVGYLVVPEELIEWLSAARWLIDRHSPPVEQAVLADFINEGHFVRHVRRMRTLYAERQAALVDAVQRHLDGILTTTAMDSGLHLIGELCPPHTESSLLSAAASAGVELMPTSWFAFEPLEKPSFLLGYAPFRHRELVRAAKGLAKACNTGRGRKAPP